MLLAVECHAIEVFVEEQIHLNSQQVPTLELAFELAYRNPSYWLLPPAAIGQWRWHRFAHLLPSPEEIF